MYIVLNQKYVFILNIKPRCIRVCCMVIIAAITNASSKPGKAMLSLQCFITHILCIYFLLYKGLFSGHRVRQPGFCLIFYA
ncbi:MAG: hypothetical protein RL172_2416 [Bacteroidota bacterium]|jgi:hypothetical protein